MSERWWVQVGGEATGPYSPEEAVSAGVKPDTLVCTDGGSDWIPAREAEPVMTAIRKEKAKAFQFVSVTEEKKSWMGFIAANPRVVKIGIGIFFALVSSIFFWYIEKRTGIDFDPGLDDFVAASNSAADMGTQSELMMFAAEIPGEFPPSSPRLTPVNQLPGLRHLPATSSLSKKPYLYQCVDGQWRVVVEKASGGYLTIDSESEFGDVPTLDPEWKDRKPKAVEMSKGAKAESKGPSDRVSHAKGSSAQELNQAIRLANLGLTRWYAENSEKYPVAKKLTELLKVPRLDVTRFPGGFPEGVPIRYQGDGVSYRLEAKSTSGQVESWSSEAANSDTTAEGSDVSGDEAEE